MERPTLDDLQREQREFIGPPAPRQPPKMPRSSETKIISSKELKEQFPRLFGD